MWLKVSQIFHPKLTYTHSLTHTYSVVTTHFPHRYLAHTLTHITTGSRPSYPCHCTYSFPFLSHAHTVPPQVTISPLPTSLTVGGSVNLTCIVNTTGKFSQCAPSNSHSPVCKHVNPKRFSVSLMKLISYIYHSHMDTCAEHTKI